MKRVILIAAICLLIFSGCSKSRSPYEIQGGLGSEYMHAGEYEKAIEAFTAAIELEPEEAKTYISRAEAYCALGEIEGNLSLALADYEKALSMCDGDLDVMFTQLNIAEVRIRMGDNEKALEIMQNISASQKTEVTSGTCGADLRWTLEDGVLTISGSGPMDGYSFHSVSAGEYSYEGAAPWRGIITEVIIEDGVTSIGEYAFDECFSLRKITIPESVISIGWGAFRSCMSLESVTLPTGITNIGRMAFYECTSLKEVTIPENVTTILDYAFSECYSMEAITIPSGVTEIGFSAFRDWTSKQTIYLEGRTAVPGDWGYYWLTESSAQVVCEE